MATSLPFYRWLVAQGAFAPLPGRRFSVHAGWIEAQYPDSVIQPCQS